MYLEMCQRLKEEAQEKVERETMAMEDELSRIAPKTKGPTPKVLFFGYNSRIRIK